MSRIMGIDYGLARIGLALSDPTKTIASPLKTIKTGKTHKATSALLLLEIEHHDVEALVLGLPLLLSGGDSAMTRTVRHFATILEEQLGLPLTLWDERLTSKEVQKVLIAAKVKRKKQTEHIDKLSATLILQNYLERIKKDHN